MDNTFFPLGFDEVVQATGKKWIKWPNSRSNRQTKYNSFFTSLNSYLSLFPVLFLHSTDKFSTLSIDSLP